MRATIKDVARYAGVSVATVSLALNDPDSSISERTREAVFQAAQALDYRPNRLAIGLVTKRTHTLGLIIPENVSPFQAAFSSRIEAVAAERGYSTIFGAANHSVDRTIHHLQNFSDHGVDGIILTESTFSDPKDTDTCVSTLEKLRMPIVLTDRVPPGGMKDTVRVNDFKGGYTAVKYLLDSGHRRVGIVTGQLWLDNCVARLEGCKRAFLDAGLPFDEALAYQGEFRPESGMAALPYLLGQGVTAVFAFNDMTAFGVYKAAKNYGVSIPGELSVIGFDDIFFAEMIDPPLTSMEFPIKKMAAAIVDLLVKRIDSEAQQPAQVITFDPALKVRGSTRRIAEEA